MNPVCAWCTHDKAIHGSAGCTQTNDAGERACLCEQFITLDRSVENIERLANLHLNRYEARMEAALRGNPGFRIAELHELIKLWEEVSRKGYHFELLSEEAKTEVSDALWDEVP